MTVRPLKRTTSRTERPLGAYPSGPYTQVGTDVPDRRHPCRYGHVHSRHDFEDNSMTQDLISQDLGLLPLEVAHTSFLLERLGQDCEPLQYLRELTQNSIEAIGRTRQPGDILWHAAPVNFPSGASGLKLSITDTGDGMSASELEGHINRLSSSGSPQTHEGNFGVGAKVSTALNNPAGIRYRSWKQGQGHEILLCRDAVTGHYGLRQYALGSDEYSYSPAVPEDSKPATIGTHGTEVTLLGQSEAANTAMPAGAKSPAWIAKYLNSRYYRFPQAVTVRVDEGALAGQSDPARIRTLTGQKAYLGEHSEASGTCKLTGAVARWWILSDTSSLHADSQFVESAGHTAALYKDELYELRSGRNGVARLQQFGITFGFRRVVIYVEPRNHNRRRIGSNTTRSHLLLNRQPLPWSAWAAEFSKKLPVELRRLVADEGAARQPDHSLVVQRRLSKIMDLFKPRRYRFHAKGKDHVEPSGHNATRSAKARARKAKKASEKHCAKRKSQKAADTGQPAEKSAEAQSAYPKTVWISREDGTRAQGFLEDRAAAYLPEQNLLQINRDFSVFADTIAYCSRGLVADEGAQKVIRDTVYSWYEQALVESVLGMRALRNAKEWSDRDIEKALSSEALTAAVMQRYHIITATRECVRHRLRGLAVPAAIPARKPNYQQSRVADGSVPGLVVA